MSYPECILEEVNPISNQKVVNCEEPCKEICTPDYHADNCDCFEKQEQKIKELQAELDRQRKLKEETTRKQKLEEENKRKLEEETQRKQRLEEEKKHKLEEETQRKQKLEEDKKCKLEEETKRKQKEKEDKERKMDVVRVKLNEFATYRFISYFFQSKY